MREDDDLEATFTSRAESLSRADRGKQEQKERKAAEKGKLNQLKLETLRQRVEGGKADHETKRSRKNEKKPETFGTKTREEEVKAAIDTATTKPEPERLIEKAKQEDAADKQARIEEDQDQTG